MTLLDVNVWLAAAWARHTKHSLAKRWIDGQNTFSKRAGMRARYPSVRIVDVR